MKSSILAILMLSSCARHYPANPSIPDTLRVTYLQVTVGEGDTYVRYVEAGDQNHRYKTIKIEQVK